ncbi:MAG: P-loop NTPase [Candidatus Aenigmarchaeota archaeon]|nr:P-loop NTPase [Candidatus Aenigmarchaeota archaeon]
MGRIIAISSGKGGVGKTTMCANLAAALADLGKTVVAVDTNFTTPNLGMHLGIPLYPITIQDILRGRAGIKDAIYNHQSGFRILPADVSIAGLMVPKANELLDIFYKLRADFVLIDSAAGLGKETKASLEAADELITVANPEMTSITDAIKLHALADRYQTRKVGVIVNMVRNEGHEMDELEIANFLEAPVLGQVRDDRHVRQSIAAKRPVVHHRPGSKAARQIKGIAARLCGVKYQEPLLARIFRL